MSELQSVLIFPIIVAVIIVVAGLLITMWLGIIAPTFTSTWATLAKEGYVINSAYPTIPSTIFGYTYVVIQWFPIMFTAFMVGLIVSAFFITVNPILWLIDALLIPIYSYILSIMNNAVLALITATSTVQIQVVGSNPATYVSLYTVLATNLQPGFWWLQNYGWISLAIMCIYIICAATRVWLWSPKSMGGTAGAVQQGQANSASFNQWVK